MSPANSETEKEAANVVVEPATSDQKKRLIWARKLVDLLQPLESHHCTKTTRLNFVAMKKRQTSERKLVCEDQSKELVKESSEANCRRNSTKRRAGQNDRQQLESSEMIWLIERPADQWPSSRVMTDEEEATNQRTNEPMELARQDKSRTKDNGAISSRKRIISLNAISTLPPIIVFISLALLVTIGRTSGSSSNISKPASSSLQQLAKSADVELNRSQGLQRLQRDTVGGGNSTSGSGGLPTCGYPGSPAHASVTFNTSHVAAGTAATYTCDNGYELLGPPRRICQPNGTWAPIGIPFCVLNVGLGKAAMQSSVAGQQQSAQKAVDGSTSPYYQPSTCTMTDVETNPWWYVNLLEPYLVQIVRIDFGMACCANRQKAIVTVRVGNNRPDLGNNPVCNRYHGFIEEGKPLFLPCTRPAPGAFVSIHLESPTGSALSICETFIYTDHALSIEQCPSFREQPLGSTATYNGKCYLFHNNQALTFDSARKLCEIRGGTLVDETSPALQGFLSWELYRRHRNDQLMGQYWLGAVRDPRQAQNWKWINGRDVQVSFWNSLAGQGNCSRFDGSKGWLWSDTDCQSQLNFICQFRPLSCGKPEKPTNSTLITRNVDNGTVIEYQCAPGNLLMGPKSRTCLPTGFFSEFAPKCKYLDCQFPAQIANGDYKLLNSSTSYQSMVTYFCNDGHQLYGRPTLTCDVDERWNGPPPRCEPLLCPAPIAPQNGHVTVTSNITVPGTQATYECRPGYELVGEHLLSCLRTGSWDQSFPYCRERRHIASAAAAAAAAAANPSAKPASGPRQQTQAVQFPGAPAATSFSSNRVAPVALSNLSPPLPSSTPSTAIGVGPTSTLQPAVSSSSAEPNLSSASLNGLASQQQPPVSGNEISPNLANGQNGNELPKSRKPASPNVGSFVSAPTSPISVTDQLSRGDHDQQQHQRGGPSRAQSPALRTPLAPQRPPQGTSSTAASNAASRFTFNPIHSTTTSTSLSPVGHNFDTSNQLATTNSISIHQQIGSSSTTGQPQLVSASSDPSTMGPGSSTTSASSPAGGLQTAATSSTSGHSLANFANQHHHNQLSPPPPARASSHNSMANAKNSLDGIIAVAIFGGFIFLGAIITILVIIIRRRKGSRSSVIDAQTISTYDSNQEHNGLYRNYQQAWENLRFSAPNSQPKSSGNGPPGGVNLAANPGSMALKSYASGNVAILHHAHPIHTNGMAHNHNIAGLTQGNNLGSGSTTSSTSHTSSSVGNGGGSGGGDPLLGARHSSHFHHHHHHHQQQQMMAVAAAGHRHHMDDDDDEDDDEQGIVTEDETPYNNQLHAGGGARLYHRQSGHLNEGFRDTNELTINADTATASGQAMSRSAGATRRSSEHAHHHHLNHHQQQRQSATSSSSAAQSSLASPDELDRLAYGHNWPSSAANNSSQLMR